jgi:hypothetical protein
LKLPNRKTHLRLPVLLLSVSCLQVLISFSCILRRETNVFEASPNRRLGVA